MRRHLDLRHAPLRKIMGMEVSLSALAFPGRGVWTRAGGALAFLAGLIPLTLLAPASAETIASRRDTLMCASPETLARLILPDGRSRIGTPSEASGDRQAALSGGCVDVPPGTQVEVQSARTNTSVVTYDAKDGHGPHTLVVPNVNFFRSVSSPGTVAGGSCLRFAGESGEITLSGVAQPRQHLETRPGGDPDNPRDVSMMHFVVLELDRPLCAQIIGGIVAVPPTVTREVGVEGDNPDARRLLHPWIGKRVVVSGKLLWRGRAVEAFTDLYLNLTDPQIRAASP